MLFSVLPSLNRMFFRSFQVFIFSGFLRSVRFLLGTYSLVEYTQIRGSFHRWVIIFKGRTSNCLRIAFRDYAQDVLIFRHNDRCRYKYGQGARQVDRSFIVFFRDVFTSVWTRTKVSVFRRCFSRVVPFKSGSHVFFLRLSRVNRYQAGRQINEGVQRTAYFMGFFRIYLSQYSVQSSAM